MMLLALGCAAPFDGVWLWSFTTSELGCGRSGSGGEVEETLVRVYETSRDRHVLQADDPTSPLGDRVLLGELDGDQFLAADETGEQHDGDECELSAYVLSWSLAAAWDGDHGLTGVFEYVETSTGEDCHGNRYDEVCMDAYSVVGTHLDPGPATRREDTAAWGEP